MAGDFSDPDRRAIKGARERMLELLKERFPAYTWRMPTVQRREAILDPRPDIVELIDLGAVERDANGWDFALVVTESDLRTYLKPHAYGAPSAAVAVGVLSTARLDPVALRTYVSDEERIRVIRRRLVSLALHLFGHLNGLDHRDASTDAMHPPNAPEALDTEGTYAPDDHERLEEALAAVADARLEETGQARGRRAAFYALAATRGARDILSAVVDIRPWEFPFRLSRLTTAAASTLVVLLITAEAWELGMSQPAGRVVLAAFVALVATSAYLIRRQRLLVRRHRGSITERRVIGNVSITIAIVLGMATTFGLLFAGTLALALLFFDGPLVGAWTASLGEAPGAAHYFTLAGFFASLGLAVGALGASFEARGYFRHLAYVDEET